MAGLFSESRKEEIRSMLFVQWMCERLANSNPKEVGELLSYSFQEDHDNVARISRAEKNLSAAKADTEKWLVAALDLYKVYFESDFRLWSTIPFCFASKYFGLKTHLSNPADIVHVGASEKFNSLKNIKIDVPQGDLRRLIAGFDSNVRNSGAGHDRWELSDRETLVLSVRDPRTGKEKGVERIELDDSDLQDLLDQVRTTIWVLKMGTVIFSINHPEITSSMRRTKEVKIKEIETHVKTFAKDRWLKIERFSCTQDRKRVELTLKYSPGRTGVGGSVFSSAGERFDLISIESTESYASQILDVIQYMLDEFFPREAIPSISINCLDDRGAEIGKAEFQPPELLKLYDRPCRMPSPIGGALPSGTYRMQGEVRVPYGKRAEYLKLVTARLAPNMRIIGEDITI